MSYEWEGMQKIGYKEALDRFVEEDKTVFLLYDDGTEAEAENVEEIVKHYGYCGEFGYEKEVS